MFILDVTFSNSSIWISIIVALIGSGAVASLITNLWNNQLKKNEFEWDYKKYVLENRKKAYDTINVFAHNIFLLKIDDDGFTYVDFFLDTSDFETDVESVIIQFQKLDVHTFWLSNDMVLAMENLKNYFVEILFKYKTGNPTLRNGIKFTEAVAIKNFSDEFKRLFWKDLKELNNIKKFILNKQQENSFFNI